ncbi:MAG: carboxylesterase family protein [Actinobacteria bacterium]|nr:carboxylesterase family protein [Actinomycetota bacterium]
MGAETDLAALTFRCAAGEFVGWIDGEVVRASGIRYARAERFGLPVAEPTASEPVLAQSWSPACPQQPDPLAELLGDSLSGLPLDEHCQYLTVTMPADRVDGELLPVMVWVHGGSYAFGAGDAKIYDAASLAASQRVVVVNVTYRLGIFGFLGGPSRRANLGLYDIIEAFRWVNANIEGFGGDPQRICAFGESAGADAIAHMMIAEGAEGLFRRAIIQSAPFGITRDRAPMTAAMCAAAGPPDLSATPESIVDDADRVCEVALPFGMPSGMPFGVQYGFAPMPDEDQLDAAWAAAATRVDVLIGSTTREAALFVPRIPRFAKLAGIPVIGRALTEVVVRVATWKIYGRDVRRFAKRHRSAGGSAAEFRYSWGPPGNPLIAAHGTDIPLLFGSWDHWKHAPILEGVEAEFVLDARAKLQDLWGRFAREGSVPDTSIPKLISIRNR